MKLYVVVHSIPEEGKVSVLGAFPAKEAAEAYRLEVSEPARAASQAFEEAIKRNVQRFRAYLIANADACIANEHFTKKQILEKLLKNARTTMHWQHQDWFLERFNPKKAKIPQEPFEPQIFNPTDDLCFECDISIHEVEAHI